RDLPRKDLAEYAVRLGHAGQHRRRITPEPARLSCRILAGQGTEMFRYGLGVEDRLRGRGIGTALVRAPAGLAVGSGPHARPRPAPPRWPPGYDPGVTW